MSVPGDVDYEEIDGTRQRLEEMPGYQAVQLRPVQVDCRIYTVYDAAHRRESDGNSYISPATVPEDGDYEEPDRATRETSQHLQDMPGYQSVRLRPGQEETYTAYDTTHRKVSDTIAIQIS